MRALPCVHFSPAAALFVLATLAACGDAGRGPGPLEPLGGLTAGDSDNPVGDSAPNDEDPQPSGPTGPTGPTGATGPTGPTGATGPTGPSTTPVADDAVFGAISPPTTVACGTTFNLAVPVDNRGSAVWQREVHRLGFVGDTSPFMEPGSAPRVDLPEGVSVAGGATYIFQVPLRAPAAAGTARLSLRMVHELVTWFGATFERDIVVTCGGGGQTDGDAAEVVAVAMPASVVCNGAALGQITLRNSGTTTWLPEVFSLGVLDEDNPLILRGDLRYGLGPEWTVAPGETYTFAMTVSSADVTVAQVQLQMVHELVTWFGPVIPITVDFTGPCKPEPTCDTPAATLAGEVTAAVNHIVDTRPELFRDDNGHTLARDAVGYMYAVVARLNATGLVAFVDPWAGDEISVRQSEAFSEHYDILTYQGWVRSGSGAFTSRCAPAAP